MALAAATEYYGYVNQVDPEQGDEYVAMVKDKVQREIGYAYTVTSMTWKMLKMGGKPTKIREGTLVWTATGPPYWHTWTATTIWVKEHGKTWEKELKIGGVSGGGILQRGRPRAPQERRERKGKREREEDPIPFPAGRVTRQMLEDWKEANKKAREGKGAGEG